LLLLVIIGVACSHDEPVGPAEVANAPGLARRPGDPPLGPPVFPPKSPPTWTGAPTTLTIAKTANPSDGNVAANDPFSFDVTVTNTGGQTATRAFLTDDLPDFSSSWSFEQIAGGVTVTCLNLGDTFLCGIYRAAPGGGLEFAGVDLAPGQSYTVRFTAANDQGDCGAITNTASVVADNAPGVSASASVTVACPPQANLEIVKTGFPTDQVVGFGESFYFDVTVTNTGDATAIRAFLTDDLPDFASNWTFEQIGGDVTVTCVGFATFFLCGIFQPAPGGGFDLAGVDIPPGESYTLRFTAANDQGDCGPVTNTASIAAENVPRVEDSGSVTVICPSE
jgi:uncharacterized repeat protein (TIGR01451 family)